MPHRTQMGVNAFTHGSAGHDATLPAAAADEMEQLLDALDTGVLVLSHDLVVEYANGKWARWMGAPVQPGTSFGEMLDDAPAALQDELRATHADGEPRTLVLRVRGGLADARVRRLSASVRRHRDGLLLEARADIDDDRVAMHDVARQLAEVTDMGAVLTTLCGIATDQCNGTGAAAMRVIEEQGEVVAAAGDLAPARGRSFALRGSLLHEAMHNHVVVSEENFSDSGRPLMREVPELALGPLMLAPLRAHGQTLGVLAVSRAVGARPFRMRDRERLMMLADHAALAVHKSLLLLQAQSADRAKGRFLATMSHELRTPLTALAGYNELLADEVIGPLSEPQLDVLERMRSVTTHLSAMIEEILAFSSLEEGRDVVRPTDFLAEDLVRAAVAVVEPLAQHKSLTLDVALPVRSVRMTSDVDKARQILVNLLGNAVKFTDAGSVSVRLSAPDGAVRIEVRDTGIGIPPEELSRLFRPFAQVDTGLTRRHGGTGLGLYISRRLVTLLGGHIEVMSHPGAGSTFSVVLPTHFTPTR